MDYWTNKPEFDLMAQEKYIEKYKNKGENKNGDIKNWS